MTKIEFNQKVLLYNEEGKFLALKATYKKLRWDLPGGGVEIPELHDSALQREISEETGLMMTEVTPLYVESAFDTTENRYVIFIGYKAKAKSINVRLSSEHSEYRWVTKEEFLHLDIPPYFKNFITKSV